MIYVALLRGINVGGNNKVEMKKLKTTFELLGFSNVVTYINSGNIVFETTSNQQATIENKIENAIKKDFQLELRVLIKDFKSMKAINKKLPNTWVQNKMMRTDVMFLWEKYDDLKILEQLRIQPVDTVKYVSGAILWNIEGKNYNKSGMSKLVGTELYRNMTIRNANTFRKLHQIMSDLFGQKTTNR